MDRLNSSIQLVIDLEMKARAAGCLLWVDTNGDLKCTNFRALKQHPELSLSIVKHRAMLKQLIISRSL